MSMSEKDEVMAAFRAGVVRVLIATTVVEVGVHVPRPPSWPSTRRIASACHSSTSCAGAWGAAGREGFCFLLSGDTATPEATERLEVLVREADGFRIAEEDLRLRGPGEFLGTRQHGVPAFKVANPLHDRALVERANERGEGALGKGRASCRRRRTALPVAPACRSRARTRRSHDFLRNRIRCPFCGGDGLSSRVD
jgi:ATP-dependent DNA helicase RecG